MADADGADGTADETRIDQQGPLLGNGTVIAGRYHLEALLGSGGMAQVWQATDVTLGRRVAVKVLHPHLATDETFVKRFRQEAIAAARLSHPGIVGIYDTCSDGHNEAIVMELLDASTLREVLDDRGTLDAESVHRVGLRLLDALEAAHRAGLVHRDVKPSNILLCADGTVKIADFGIAKADDHTELTREGSLVGTASYLAPEQLTDSVVDGRSDLYSLGIVLYECLVGRIPFQGDSGAAVALARLRVDPVDPRRYRSDVPAALADTIMRALQRDPSDRFADAAAFRAALTSYPEDTTAHPVAEIPPEASTRPPAAESFSRSERRWLVPALGILLVAAALIVAGLLLRQTRVHEKVPGSTTPPLATAARIESVRTFDPDGKGDPGENDAMANAVIDDNTATIWRTETYESPTFFESKDGVGLVLDLAAPSVLNQLKIEGSTNGYSATIHLIESGSEPDQNSQPVAAVNDVRGPVTVDLHGVRADRILLWITNLGDPEAGRYRVEIAEVTVYGTALR